MENKNIQNKEVTSNVREYNRYQGLLNLLFFAVATFFFYNGYKLFISALMGHPPLALQNSFPVTSYLLPVAYFIYHIYNCFVKKIGKVGRFIFITISTLIAIFNFVGIGIFFEVYTTNAANGLYSSLLNIGLSFPVDAIIINIIILLLNAMNLFFILKPNTKYIYIQNSFENPGVFKFRPGGYTVVVIFALIGMYFLGAFFNGLSFIDNTLYNSKFIFLLLICFVPVVNFIYHLINLKRTNISQKSKIINYAVAVGINVIFLVVFLILRLVDPYFVTEVGKPFFPFTFIISIPFNVFVLCGSMLISTAMFSVYLVREIIKKK